MFSELKKKKSMLAFLRTLFDYNLARGLAVHARFDDLDLISRSQVCQTHTLQIVFRLNGAWLLHTLKRSSTGNFVRPVCIKET